MNNSNNKWLYENPLLKNKNQRYYYDFGTGIEIEREEVKEERDAILNSATKTSNKPTNQKKDDFLEGFDDPYGEKREQERQRKEQERKERFAKIRENADKRNWTPQSDPFLEGFNQTSKDENLWESTLGSVKSGATATLKKTKEKGKEIINNASAWANEKGIFDDVTNAFFKVSDISQDYPFRTIPTDLTHQILANVNHKENQKIDLSVYEADSGYINDQNVRGSQSGKIRYGTGTFNQNGCEIIAVNNALVSLRDRRDIRDIAKDFETDGQVLFGAFGTSPYAINDYFKKQGYQVETFTGDKKIYNLNIPEADTYIISFWNSDKATNMIHTVSVDKLDNGKYRIYNENGRRVLDVNSLNEYLIKNNRVPLVLHCIKKG